MVICRFFLYMPDEKGTQAQSSNPHTRIISHAPPAPLISSKPVFRGGAGKRSFVCETTLLRKEIRTSAHLRHVIRRSLVPWNIISSWKLFLTGLEVRSRFTSQPVCETRLQCAEIMAAALLRNVISRSLMQWNITSSLKQI